MGCERAEIEYIHCMVARMYHGFPFRATTFSFRVLFAEHDLYLMLPGGSDAFF
jgi:hypothetical protein